MKKVKKARRTVLFILLAGLLIGCGKQEQAEEASTVTTDSAANEASTEVRDEESSDAETSNDSEEVRALLGTTSDSVYKNDYFGFQFTLPEEYVYESEEDLFSENSFNAGSTFVDEMGKALSETYYPVLVMSAEETGSAAFDGVDNVSVEIIHEDGQVTEEGIKDMLAETVTALQGAYTEDTDGKENKIETTTISFLGQDRQAISFDAESSGIEIYEKIILVPKDEYVAVITVASPDENKLENLLSKFSE